MDREALAEFLLRRRAELQPSDVGLSPGPRRRAAGLRREEVAQLATMSTDYYTRLEQRRGPQPSPQMLAALARALRLTADERDYLYRVAGHSAPDRAAVSDYVAPGLLRIFDRITDTPALIFNAIGETLVQNAAARGLFGDASNLTGMERSSFYRWFSRPDQERIAYPPEDHDRQSRAQVASLRVAYGLLGPKSRAGEMVDDLIERSPEFARLWQEHAVARRFEDHKTLIHPHVGRIEVDCQVLLTEDESQALLVLTAAPRSVSAFNLELLAVIGTQEFSPI